MAETGKALTNCEDALTEQGKALTKVNLTMNDLGFRFKNMDNEKNNNPNGRGKQNFKGNNNKNRERNGRKNPYNPDVTCERCETIGHTEQTCFRQACSCKASHTRSVPALPTCTRGE